MPDPSGDLQSMHLAEYEKVKDEQIARIGHRDGLVYATLGAVAAVVAFGATQHGSGDALLILPIATTVLGWLYLVNDEKISAIGRYVRHDLTPRLASGTAGKIFMWEHAHRADARRKQRKFIQFFMDELLFVGGGGIGLLLFLCGASNWHWVRAGVIWLDVCLLLFIAYQIWAYADFSRESVGLDA